MDTVLIVDDDPDIRDLLVLKFTDAGFGVQTAADAETALTTVEAAPPNAILLDWMMPRTSGIDLCRRLHTNPRFVNIPIIMLSAKARSSDIRQSLAAGATGYFVKPFSPGEVLTHVQVVIEDSAGRERGLG